MNKIKKCHFAMVGPVFCSDSNTVHSQPDSPDGFTYLSESVWYQNPFVHIATKNTLCIGIGIRMEESAGEIENRSPLPLFGYYVHTYYRIPLMWLSIHPWLNNGFDDYSHLFYRTIGPKLFWILNWICKLFFTGHFLIFLRLKFETISLEITKYLVQFCYQ